jgi:SAM-dependent methyltransferase
MLTKTMEKNCNCPLCFAQSSKTIEVKKRVYFICNNCFSVFCHPDFLLNSSEEFSRYQKHVNDVNDLGYQAFVSPITSSILSDFTPDHRGLDFGAGTGPVITKILRDNNFNIQEYDPFFFNYPELLLLTYNYIPCCEVVEHFYNPHREFSLLKKLLKPGGKLYIMTDLLKDLNNFKDWYYIQDPTHVFFYSQETFEYIKRTFGFTSLTINKRLVILEN